MGDVLERIPLSIRIPADLHEALDRIAKALDRDRTWVMVRALRQYLENEGGDILEDAEGRAAIERGEGVDFDQFMDEMDEMINRAEARRRPTNAG